MDSAGLLKDLNAEQKQAVTHGEGPLMIVAGAGTGKTTVITKRIAWLIAEGKAKPEEILALTFTDKAANEMEERVDRLLPMGYVDLSISTFHSFCEKILRERGLDIGLSPDFVLYDEVDCWLMMRRHIDDFKLDYFKPRGNPSKFFRAMLAHFSRAKDEGVTPEAYAKQVDSLIIEDELEHKKWQELSAAYFSYEHLLASEDALDFGGLLMGALRLFKERPNVLADYRKRFSYLVVDEFQDTNSVQYELVKLLAEPKRNITIVGDDDQAIYRFRGAALKNILTFREDFPDTNKVVLTKNYRSGKNILDQAYKLIQNNNPHRLEVSEGLSKQLTAEVRGAGFVQNVHLASHEDEVVAVVKQIAELKCSTSAAWSDFCILVRANDSAGPFLEGLESAGMPFRFLALSGLYTQSVILDALAYLRLIDLPHNSVAAYRVLSHPRLGLNERDLSELMMFVRRKGLPVMTALERITQANGVSLEGKSRALEITAIISQLRDFAKRLPIAELFKRVIYDTGLLADIGTLPEAEQAEAFAHLNAFLRRVKRFAVTNEDRSLRSFLQEFEAERAAGEDGALPGDAEQGPDVVHVMTAHAAKGLEFRYVFVVNLIEQRFPSVNRSEALPLPPGLIDGDVGDHVAEERRLFYVAMTRAKEGLYLLSAEDYGGARKRKRSRFLVELGFGETALTHLPGGVEAASPTESTRAVTQNEHTPDAISFSQIAAFDTCPLQYKYAHILKVPTFGNPRFSFGQSIHNTLHRFLQRLLDNQATPQSSLFDVPPAVEPAKVPPLGDLLQIFDGQFIDEWYDSQEDSDTRRKEGRAALKKVHERLLSVPPKLYALEKGFTLKVGGVQVKGRIDRVDELPEGGLEVIDYKSGEAKTALDWDRKRQLILYALALEECFVGAPAVKKLTYYYVEHDTTLSFEPTAEDKERLKEEILETWQSIQNSDFAAKPDQWKCSYCDFKDICPSAKSG